MMDTKTAIALEESIAHWDELSRAERIEDVEIGPTDCALCNLFLFDRCNGCPVKEAGHHGCIGTPYEAAEELYNKWDDQEFSDEKTYAANRDAFRAAALDERDFLIGLRAPNKDSGNPQANTPE